MHPERIGSPQGGRQRSSWLFLVVLTSCFLLVVLPASALGTTPSIEGESVSGITATGAVLEATIDPESTERGADYQFQVVEAPNEYASTFMCPTEGWPANSSLCLGLGNAVDALPIGQTSAVTQAQSVSVNLASFGGWGSGSMALKPSTTYHYRVIAAKSVLTVDTIAWEPPVVYGPDRTFTTLPAGAGMPSIESESVSHVTSTDATLEAQINTDGLETTYEFHVVGAYCEWPCESPEYLFTLPAGKLLGSHIGQSVSLDLNSAGVRPMHVNTYWVSATNAAGTATGPSHTFRSEEAAVQPLATIAPSGVEAPVSSSLGSQPAGSTSVPEAAAKPFVKHRRRRHKHRRSKAKRGLRRGLKRSGR